MRLAARITLVIAVTAALAIVATRFLGWFAILIMLPAVWFGARMIISRVEELHAVLGNALSAFKDGDFSLRLAVRGDHELAELKRMYNELADAVRDDRRTLHEKEVLLDTILQRTPVAVMLLNAAGRVIYSNAAARELFTGGARLHDRLLSDVPLVAPLREALSSAADSIFRNDEETFHLTQRVFHLNTQQHRLVLVERLTPELRRQEVGIWKKAIRVMNHELNNTIAPISSLFHSARRAQSMPEHHHRLDEIHALIEERLAFLRQFLDAYAEFARLPAPRKETVAWSEILAAAAVLYPFRVAGTPSLACSIDRAQMQQVVINLVKNAHESGSAPDEIVVSISRTATDCVLQVLDRGRGMPDDVARQALLPFFSTRPGGSGVGLALANEIVEAHGGHLRLQAREGGGTAVTCWLPV